MEPEALKIMQSQVLRLVQIQLALFIGVLASALLLTGCGSSTNKTATPVILPAAGTYAYIPTLSIVDATPGASIYYTTDGSTPTASSTPFSFSTPLTVSQSETVNVIAVAANRTSTMASAAYTINLPPAPAPVLSPASGVFSAGQTVTITDIAPGALIYYTTDGSTPTTSSTLYKGPINVAASAVLNAVAISQGYGYSYSATAGGAYTILFSPTFSLTAGTYSTAQQLTISESTAGAAVYYTTNGSTPTTASTLYKGPITIPATETVSAIAAVTPSGATSSVTSSAISSAYIIHLAGTSTVLSGTALSGQPVSGASIQLYAVGTSGYTSAATPLLASPLTSDNTGSFIISGKYTCTPGSYLYLTASGGITGSNKTSNPNLTLAAVVGLCDNLTPASSFIINEETTVAAAYALAQFANGSAFGHTLVSQPGSGSSAPADDFATSSTNVAGLANAMAISQVLASTSTGSSPGSNTTGSISGVTGVTISTAGSGYTSIPTVTFSAPANGTTATGIVGMSIGGVTITNPGAGYTGCPTLTFSTPDQSTGTGTRAAGTAICNASFNVTGVTITTPGSNYTSMPIVTFTNANTGSVNAAGVGIPGAVTTVNVTGGSGYTSAPTVTFSASSSGTTAVGTAAIGTVSAGNAATPEWWQVNLIANMLASCVNSPGGTSGDGSKCGTLFANVLNGGAAPADTLQAALDLALYPTVPSANIANLSNLIPASGAPFQPYPSTAASVTDFSIGIQYQPMAGSTTLLKQPTTISFDSLGNAWVANQPTATAPSQGFLVELSPTGVPTQAGSTAGTYSSNYVLNSYSLNGVYTAMGGQYVSHNNAAQLNGLFAPAIDTSNNLWISDRENSAMVKITGSGTTYSNSLTYQNGGNALDSGGKGATAISLPAHAGPEQTYIDGSNNVWFTMTGVADVSSSSTATPCTTLTLPGSSTNLGLGVFINENPSTAKSGSQFSVSVNTPSAFIAIDPNVRDYTTVGGVQTPIPGAPFVWGIAGTGNTATDLALNYSQPSTSNLQACDPASTAPETITSTGALGVTSTGNTQLPAIPNPLLAGDTLYPMATINDITFDKFGNLWIANQGQIDSQTSAATSEITSSISKITPNYGSAFTIAQTQANFTFNVYHQVASLYDGIGGLLTATYYPQYLTSDGGGNIWFAMSSAGSKYVNAISNTGAALSPYTVTSPGTGNTTGGFAGSVCTSCILNGTTATYRRPNTLALGRPAVDQSGDVWIPVNGVGSTYVDLLVGIAVPRVNPDSFGLKNKTFAAQP
jgi:hypothetical protein